MTQIALNDSQLVTSIGRILAETALKNIKDQKSVFVPLFHPKFGADEFTVLTNRNASYPNVGHTSAAPERNESGLYESQFLASPKQSSTKIYVTNKSIIFSTFRKIYHQYFYEDITGFEYQIVRTADGKQTNRGVHILTDGPDDRYTVVGLLPNVTAMSQTLAWQTSVTGALLTGGYPSKLPDAEAKVLASLYMTGILLALRGITIAQNGGDYQAWYDQGIADDAARMYSL